MSIAIIGGGIAGAAAASEIARQGERATLFHAHAGSSALYSGALDFDAWDPAAAAAPIEPELLHFCAALGIWELGGVARRIATLEGSVRPTRGSDRALLDLERCAGKRVGVIDLERDDWDAPLLARSFAASAWARETGTGFEAIPARGLWHGAERRTSSYDFAALHDIPERAQGLLAALAAAETKPEAWLIGPWLGIERSLAADFSAKLAVPVGETSSGLGGAAGARFERARDRLLGEVANVERRRVKRVERVAGGYLIEADERESQRFAAVVIASGGVAAGGVALERSFERRGGTGFRLSFAAPVAIELDREESEGVSSLSSIDFVERGLDALLKVGIAVQDDGSARGNPGLFVAGDAVAGRPRSALLAARSGLLAARRVLEHTRRAE